MQQLPESKSRQHPLLSSLSGSAADLAAVTEGVESVEATAVGRGVDSLEATAVAKGVESVGETAVGEGVAVETSVCNINENEAKPKSIIAVNFIIVYTQKINITRE